MNKFAIMLLATALLLGGCVTSSDKLTQVALGMNKSQVIEVLGKPKSVSARAGGGELFRYQLSGRDAPLLNPNGYRFADGYTVQLIEGKVVSFGRDDEFNEVTVKIK